MPYVVVSTGYVKGNFGKTSIVGGEDMDCSFLDPLHLEIVKKPEYRSSIGYWYVVKMPARQLIEKLAGVGFKIHSQCANDKDAFWTLHKPL